ncbi:hypothetical protein AMAG_02817 [Allomyces macrogynus ATCC 38327]|uniref:Uncharacterized protein n=1 Tax=Allomyces macrogynus (strain ATCC 38327) TaxID=578462 RepID=A0A0L0S3W2_ALLM3|nr:hypothetical protein AMAG_02817 [Allomyces macrogynus ATCC 38327]|eukprot:KNE57059.1 hypothetical protein AMAG_02817 [Allomyces macrogynus ATCC 38327]
MAPKRGRRDDDAPAASASTTFATSTGAPTTHTAADAPASATNARPKKPARTRKRWLPEEEAALYAGVQKHGVGAWAIILATNPDAFDAQRTPIDLKDKWRVLTTRRNAAAPPPPIDLAHLPRATVTRLRQAGITKRPRDPSPDRSARTEPVSVAPPTDLPTRARATAETEVTEETAATDEGDVTMDASGDAGVPDAPLAPFVEPLRTAVPSITFPAPSTAPFPAPPVAPFSAVPTNPFAALTASSGFGTTPGFLPFDDLATANLLDSLLQASAAPTSLLPPPGPVAVPLSTGSSSSPSTSSSSSSASSLAPAPTPPMLPWAAPSLASLGLLEELPLPPPPQRVVAAFQPAPPVYQFGLAPLAPSPPTAAGSGDSTWVPGLTPPASSSSASSSRSRATPGPVTIVHGCIPIVVLSPPLAEANSDHHHEMLADLIAAASPTLRNDPVFMDDGDDHGGPTIMDEIDEDGPVSRNDPNFYDYDAEDDDAASDHGTVVSRSDDGGSAEEDDWPDLAALPSLFPDDEAHERHVTEQRVREAIESGKHISKKQVAKMYVKLQKMHGVPKNEVIGLPPFKRHGRGWSRSRSRSRSQPRSGSRFRNAYEGDAHMAERENELRDLDRADDAAAIAHQEDDGGEPRGHAQCFHFDCYGRDSSDLHGHNHCRRYDGHHHHEGNDDAHPHPHSHGDDDGDHTRRRQWFHHYHHPHDRDPPVPSDFFNTRHHPAPALAVPSEPVLLRIFERRHADIIAKLKRKKEEQARCGPAAVEAEAEAAAAAAPLESAPRPAASDADTLPAAGEAHVLELADMLDAVLQLDPETRDKSLEQIATRGFTKSHKHHHMRHMRHHGDPEARQRLFARKHPHAELVGGYGFGFGGVSDDEDGDAGRKTPQQQQQPWDEVLGQFRAADQVARERGAPAAKGPIAVSVGEKASLVERGVDMDRGRHHECQRLHGGRGHSRYHSRRRERIGAADE